MNSLLMSSSAETVPSDSESTELIALHRDPDERAASKSHYYDQSQWSRYLCIAGLAFSWAISIFCIVFGALNSRGSLNLQIIYDVQSNKDILKDVLTLLQTAILSLCQEVLGYIHTVSLRWALHRDGKLDFDSNLRLWQNVKVKGPNAWYGNLIVIVGQIATFGSSAMTIAKESDSGSGWITLGIGIGMQSTIATWALLSWRDWPTWSSDPLHVAAACMQQGHNIIIPRPGRALHGLDQINHPPMSMYPSHRQESAYRAHKDVKKVTIVIWTILGLCLAWAAALLIATGVQTQLDILSKGDAWNPLTPWAAILIPLCCADLSQYTFSGRDYLWLFVLICIFQSIIALATHCAELHVNLTRDEAVWREAGLTKGHKRTSSNALKAVLKSWQSLVLLVLKVGIQWVFSLTFSLDIYEGMYLYGPQTLYLAGTVLVLALFATFLALVRPKGPQPTTYGHLQALVDLVDEWPGQNDTMYWGDKGDYKGLPIGQDLRGVRHAGTSSTPLQPIDMSAEYA